MTDQQRLSDDDLRIIEKRWLAIRENSSWDEYLEATAFDMPRLLAEVRALRDELDSVLRGADRLVNERDALSRELEGARAVVEAALWMPGAIGVIVCRYCKYPKSVGAHSQDCVLRPVFAAVDALAAGQPAPHPAGQEG